MTPLVWLFAALASGIAFGVEQRFEAEASARAVVLAAGLLIVASRLGWAGHQRFATLVACPAIAMLGAGARGPPVRREAKVVSALPQAMRTARRAPMRRDATTAPAGATVPPGAAAGRRVGTPIRRR